MNINLVWDSSVTNAPSGFKPAMQAAASYLDGLIANNITVNINVGYGEYAAGSFHETLTGTESEGGVGSAPLVSYATVLADLKAHALTTADQTAVDALPTADPTHGGNFLVSNAEAKAWGLLASNGSENDGSVGFGSGTGYDYSTSGNTVAPPNDEIDFLGIAEHELTHALGRLAGLQQAAGQYGVQDLFRYSAPGVLDLSQSTPGYFSMNGGTTDLANFATTGDLGDWNGAVADSFNAIAQGGVINPVTPADLQMMSALGFQVSCFAAGTRVATMSGEVAVQALRAGDTVRLADGGTAPVVWLGHRRVDCRRHPRPWDVRPVLVRAHAFAEGQPARDLYLSPDHAVLVRGALMPIRYLLNGATIVQIAADWVEYWHVELPAHGVLLAEGLPAESYLDTGNRAHFSGAPAVRLHPDFARGVWAARGCAPLHWRGRRVTAARRRLLARAMALGHATTADPGLRALLGGLDVPISRSGDRFIVALPLGAATLDLRSRRWVPAHMVPNSNDTRALGVAISGLWLDGREASLDSPALGAGWHPVETDFRWTDGNAALAVTGIAELAFELAPIGQYWVGELLAQPRLAAA